MDNGSPFVGYGPEVDKAWMKISYESQCNNCPGGIQAYYVQWVTR